MVRLLPHLRTSRHRGTVRFNPTMVRLLPEPIPMSRLIVSRFQSHNGAIAALEFEPADSNPNVFQSHNGAIAALCDLYACRNFVSFNPTMVRLLLLLTC